MGSKTKSRRQSTISLILLAVLLITSCQSKVSKDTEQLLLNMRNSDVKWDGNFIGLLPKLNGPTLALQKIDEPVEPLLVEALLDEERYVAAHVLLTVRAEYPITISAEDWNGLHVQLLADGTVTYQGNDLDVLHQQWIKELASNGK